ncbi:MAG: hypothetical protein N4A76_01225, partial [Firmicutes bacterium]|nr:hypothetical protein [Bacillota bacterium]
MKKLSYLLIIVIIFQAICPEYMLFAADDDIRRLNSMSEVELSHLSDIEIIEMITSSDDYPLGIDALIRFNEGTQGGYDRKEYVEINVITYRKYRKIVYGKPFDQQRNYPGITIQGSEAKYLGFNNQGNAVTNDRFPGDSEGDEPPDKEWISSKKQYRRTWDILDKSSLEDNEKISMYDHMLNSDTINDDAVGTYSLAEILYKKMGNLNRYLKSNVPKLREELESVVELQMLPTFESDGSFV